MGFRDGGDALTEPFQVELFVVNMKGVELQHLLVNGIGLKFSSKDTLSPCIHIDIIDEIHDPLHFSRDNNFIILFV